MTPSAAADIAAFDAPYGEDDDRILARFNRSLAFSRQQDDAIDRRTRKSIQAIRDGVGSIGGVEDFLREYGLSTREGLALMVLAEALLRVPDAATQDKLIEDKLREGGWSEHEAHGDTWFVNASAWAVGLSARVIRPGETPEGVMRGLVRRLGMPTVRSATRQAMRFLGGHFVLGETIREALQPRDEERGEGLPPFLRHAGRGGADEGGRQALLAVLCRCDRGDRQGGGQGRRQQGASGPDGHLGQAFGAASALSRDASRAGSGGTGAGPARNWRRWPRRTT